ncbi:MAG: ureidoglycolate lyase [Steroidobacteraceae bacterium]
MLWPGGSLRMNARLQPLKEHHLKVETATAEALAPYGALLGRRSGVKPTGLDYYNGAVAMSRPVNYQCSSQTELSLTTLKKRPFQVRYLERHFQHTQSFIPLGGKAWMGVAPPCDGDMPDFDQVRAFRFEGDTGLCLHLGTWHEFPFALEDDTDLAVVLSSQTTIDLHHRAENGIEALAPTSTRRT